MLGSAADASCCADRAGLCWTSSVGVRWRDSCLLGEKCSTKCCGSCAGVGSSSAHAASLPSSLTASSSCAESCGLGEQGALCPAKSCLSACPLMRYCLPKELDGTAALSEPHAASWLLLKMLGPAAVTARLGESFRGCASHADLSGSC